MKLIKNLLIGLLLATGLSYSSQAAVATGTILDTGTMRNTILIQTNRASVYQIEVTATANATVNFYDSDNTNQPYWGTNYTNAAYVSRTVYPTNYTYSFVGYNGYTNWYTNQGIYTLTVTNPISTNALTPLFSAVVAGNTYAVYNVDALFVRGICAVATAGTNINIVVQYRPAQ